MAGGQRPKRPHVLIGLLHLYANERPNDILSWRAEAERLLKHIRYVMSFAAAHHLATPLEDFVCDDVIEIMATSQSRLLKNAHPLFNRMGQQEIFAAAVSSFFKPPIPTQNLHFALEWFTMNASYAETRLLQAVIALENLIDSNLPKDQQRLLPEKAFRRAATKMRAAAQDQVTHEQSLPHQLVVDFLGQLPEQMQQINKLSLFDKVLRLSEAWQVPLTGLPLDEVESAIRARNWIVHRGYYYRPDEVEPTQRNLWDYILLVRELIARFVFAAIGFQGHYLSFRGGQHDEHYPPVCPPRSS